jgi:OOP family OmpA-OmpF porin
MKKFVTLCAALLMAVSFASAQTVQESKLFDNWFFGIDGGGYTKTTHNAFFKNARAMAGVKLGRYITPVYGLRADYQAYFNAHGIDSKTAINASNLSLDALFNLNNLFSGYKGEPRCFEVVGVLGAGWGHLYGIKGLSKYTDTEKANMTNKWTAKAGLQFNINLGAAKAWQVNIEPDLVYYAGNGDGHHIFDINHSFCQLTGGLTYKFGCSNGTHNFVIAKEGYTQSDIDALNAKINDQRKSLDEKDGKLSEDQNTISDLQKRLADCEATPKAVTKTETKLAPVVIFDQGKSVINASQAPSVQMIATYMKNHPNAKLTVKGYASPEGSKEINQKLSEARANAVKNQLVKKYKIDADRINVEGLGATNEVFSENDWNRVCTFVEE